MRDISIRHVRCTCVRSSRRSNNLKNHRSELLEGGLIDWTANPILVIHCSQRSDAARKVACDVLFTDLCSRDC